VSTNATQHSPHTAIAPKCGRSPSAAPAGIVASGHTPTAAARTGRTAPRPRERDPRDDQRHRRHHQEDREQQDRGADVDERVDVRQREERHADPGHGQRGPRDAVHAGAQRQDRHAEQQRADGGGEEPPDPLGGRGGEGRQGAEDGDDHRSC